MKHRTARIVPLVLAFSLLTGCGGSAAQPGQEPPPPQEAACETQTTETEMNKETEAMAIDHQVVVYFAGWNLNSRPADTGGEVASIPWEDVTYVNHAFWEVQPAEGVEETSFQRRASGQPPRTDFRIVSMHPDFDYSDMGDSQVEPGLPRNHFGQYAAFAERYPDVNIMISIGGWSRCGFFSEMAFTPEGRASFTESCMELMRQYPWIGGIDIDWEYPAGSRDGERRPGDEDDQGCPIYGTATQDRENFNALLAGLRSAMDQEFGPGTKKLTACASGSTGWTLPCQDWKGAAPYLDMINIMTYDLAGVWDGVAGLASSAALSKAGAMYFKMQDVPLEKLCIGSPMYGSGFLLKEITTRPIGAPIEPVRPDNGNLTQAVLKQWEEEAVSGYTLRCVGGRWEMGEKFDNGGCGWHLVYDDRNGGAYMYNDDEASEYYRWFVSYENELTLQEKLDYTAEKGIGGIIVWETGQDNGEHRLIGQMHDQLLQ